MSIVTFVLLGLGAAILSGVVGTVFVGLIELVIALRDPKRGPVIRSRPWRENLYHALN